MPISYRKTGSELADYPDYLLAFLSTKTYTKRISENQRSTLCRSIGGTMDAKQLEKMMGFAPGELEKAAEVYEKDEWPKGHTIKLGRPPISGEPSVVISARVGESVLEAFDEKAKRHGQTRTERLRELITLDAMIA